MKTDNLCLNRHCALEPQSPIQKGCLRIKESDKEKQIQRNFIFFLYLQLITNSKPYTVCNYLPSDGLRSSSSH